MCGGQGSAHGGSGVTDRQQVKRMVKPLSGLEEKGQTRVNNLFL